MRDVTERKEGIEAGTAKLVGTNRERIASETENLLHNYDEYKAMSKTANPYGDGKSSERIYNILKKELLEKTMYNIENKDKG